MNNEQKFLDSLSGSFYVVFNMNDTFYFAAADSCEMPTQDFITLYPFYEKYGYDLIIAYEAISRNHDPTIEEFCTDNFFKSKEFLLNHINDKFCPSLFRKCKEYEEEKKIFKGQNVYYKQVNEKIIAYLLSGEEAEGFNEYNAKKNLIEQYTINN